MSAKKTRQAGKKPAGQPPSLADLADKGYMVMSSTNGKVVHIARPAIVQSVRYLLGRWATAEAVDPPSRIGFTSAISGEGVSFVTRSVAMVLAHDYQKEVCVVDLNWAHPTKWPAGLDGDRPLDLAEVLRNRIPLDRALRKCSVQGLSVLPAGSATTAERPVLAHSPLLDTVLDDLSHRFDHLLFDLPAVHATGDSLALARKADGVVMVIGAGTTTETQVKRAIEDLVGVSMLGAVVNRQSSALPSFIRRRVGA